MSKRRKKVSYRNENADIVRVKKIRAIVRPPIIQYIYDNKTAIFITVIVGLIVMGIMSLR